MNGSSLLAGAAAGALAAAVISLSLTGAPASGAEPATGAGRLDDLERAMRADRTAAEERGAALQALVARVSALEVSRQREPAAAPEPAVEPRGTSRPAAAGAPPPGESELAPEEFRGLLTAVLRSSREGTAGPRDEERFWRAARTTSLVDDTISALEAAVEAHPGDPETRLELADAYVAKLLTVPSGPERGLWGAKAESQWQSVVESQPDHWEAQYSLAYDYSMYPDFLNKTDDAIAGFQRALEIQQRASPIAAHAKTYVGLARMYRKKGQDAKARDVLLAGAARHPDDQQIAQALRALDK